MTGEEAPAQSVMTGNGRNIRRTLTRNGISSEFVPQQVIQNLEGLDPLSEESLDDISGNWNLQADSSLSNFMDFSDFYVLPNSKLPEFWRMSE